MIDIVQWIPYESNVGNTEFQRLMSIVKDSNIILQFDTGEIIRYSNDRWPSGLVTHILFTELPE